MKQNHSSSSSSSSSSSTPPTAISSSPNSETRNWLDLPRDIIAMILQKLGAVDVLDNAQRVCTQWRSISKDPLLWRVIEMADGDAFSDRLYPYRDEAKYNKMCRNAIDRSQGNLVDISISHFCYNDLISYIADSARHLQRLRLVRCYALSDEGLIEAVKKLPFLEELELTIGHLSEKSLEAIGRCCPLLKSLKFNMQIYGYNEMDYGFAIGQTMPNLRHLQLVKYYELTNEGLLAILDGCPLLESLDLRKCGVDLGGSLGRRCAEQIKDLLLPDDPYNDYPSFRYDGDCLYIDPLEARYMCGNNDIYSNVSEEEKNEVEDDINDDYEQNAWLLDLESYPYL